MKCEGIGEGKVSYFPKDFIAYLSFVHLAVCIFHFLPPRLVLYAESIMDEMIDTLKKKVGICFCFL